MNLAAFGSEFGLILNELLFIDIINAYCKDIQRSATKLKPLTAELNNNHFTTVEYSATWHKQATKTLADQELTKAAEQEHF